jgi:hypothetical protein
MINEKLDLYLLWTLKSNIFFLFLFLFGLVCGFLFFFINSFH